MTGLRLVPLRCASCRGRLAGGASAVFLLCADCGAGFEVTDEGALSPVPVAFARYTAGAARFFPFWTFEARLRLDARASNRPPAAEGGLAARFAGRESLTFFTAAYEGDVADKGRWSLHLTMEQPDLAAAEAPKEIEAVVFSQADARLLASDLFVTSELQLQDTVRQLAFELVLANPRMTAIAL